MISRQLFSNHHSYKIINSIYNKHAEKSGEKKNLNMNYSLNWPQGFIEKLTFLMIIIIFIRGKRYLKTQDIYRPVGHNAGASMVQR